MVNPTRLVHRSSVNTGDAFFLLTNRQRKAQKIKETLTFKVTKATQMFTYQTMVRQQETVSLQHPSRPLFMCKQTPLVSFWSKQTSLRFLLPHGRLRNAAMFLINNLDVSPGRRTKGKKKLIFKHQLWRRFNRIRGLGAKNEGVSQPTARCW